MKLPEPLKMQPKAYVVTPQTLSSQKDVKDIIKDKNIAEGMSGAIAGQYRYAFDPNLDIKEVSYKLFIKFIFNLLLLFFVVF